jgi:nitrite reductase/ring-hydroxylating ferredoxin subunit
MVAREHLICDSPALANGGKGVRFDAAGQPAFAIRHENRVHAYWNRCAHVPTELDWNEGEFFDSSRLYLICATHGALYDPASGVCLGGRCNGTGLKALAVVERDGKIYWVQEGAKSG